MIRSISLKRCLFWLCWSVWLGVLFFPILPAADTWWHLASGRYLLDNGWLPEPQDPFTFGAGIAEWLNHQWLCQIIFYSVYVGLGLDGLYVLRSAVLALAFAVLPLLLNRHKGGEALVAAWGILVFVALAQGAFFFDARCYIFTYLLLSANFYCLSRYLDAQQAKFLYILPFLTALGSNLHGGFGVLLAVQGVYAVSCTLRREMRRQSLALWSVLAASLLLTAIFNPYHWHILSFPFSMLEQTVFKVGLNEWQRPSLSQLGACAALAALLLFCQLFAQLFRQRTWTLPQLGVGVFFLLLGLTAWRHAPLVSLAAIYLWIERCPARPSGSVNAGASLRRWLSFGAYAAVFASLTLGAYQLGHRWIGGAQHWTMTAQMFPREAVNFISANPQLPQNIYNPYEWGGYLEFYAYPQVRCFQDGRAHTVYSEQRYAEGLYAEYDQPWRMVLRQQQMESLLADTPEFYQVFDKYHIDLVLSSRIIGNLSERMRKLPQWSLIYSDDVSDIFVRETWLETQKTVAFIYPLTVRECCRRAEDSFRAGRYSEAYNWAIQAVNRDKAGLQGYALASAAAYQTGRAWEGLKYSWGTFLIDHHSPVLWYNLGAWLDSCGYKRMGRWFHWLAE